MWLEGLRAKIHHIKELKSSGVAQLASCTEAADSQLLWTACRVLICQKTACDSFYRRNVPLHPRGPWRTAGRARRSGTWWHSLGSLGWRWPTLRGRKPARENENTLTSVFQNRYQIFSLLSEETRKYSHSGSWNQRILTFYLNWSIVSVILYQNSCRLIKSLMSVKLELLVNQLSHVCLLWLCSGASSFTLVWPVRYRDRFVWHFHLQQFLSQHSWRCSRSER